MKHSTEDIKWSRRIRDRDGMCLVCGKSDKRLNAHHLVPRQFLDYRTSMDNGVTLCVTCHTFGKFSAHKNPLWFAQWCRSHIPYQFHRAMQRLEELA